ncbi:MAG: hypothetical protein JWN66_1533, partial [Sphingomonas bacterium]|nr:hypothetical protein [Sphingomonas bacterium]
MKIAIPGPAPFVLPFAFALPLLLALAGCDRAAPTSNASAPVAAPATPSAATTDYLARINALPERQRDAVFYRALDDAG